MTVEPNAAAGSTTHQGQTYWFCSTHCLAKFKADPAMYVGGKDAGGGPDAGSGSRKSRFKRG
jgi:Cu+-exporting ATPase